jgi:pyrroloquinoline quinone biosynthesis protein B
MKSIFALLCLSLFFSCSDPSATEATPMSEQAVPAESVQKGIADGQVSLMLLGNLQDAGSPHIACRKDCCKDLFAHPDEDRQVISLGLIDNQAGKKYMFEATPDISRQMKALKNASNDSEDELADAIFITHAHIGHYTGLAYLGKEAVGAQGVKVYTMPRMKNYLENNGPWSQLVSEKNIDLQEMVAEETINLSPTIKVTPFLVPHRDEYSETVGYKIVGPNKSALFIPDIDKWDKWERDIVEEIRQVDYAFLDATFYSGKEINNRDISQIPHPFIIESFAKFKNISKEERSKIVFIHFNHTNPVINSDSPEAQEVLKQGFNLGKIRDVYRL